MKNVNIKIFQVLEDTFLNMMMDLGERVDKRILNKVRNKMMNSTNRTHREMDLVRESINNSQKRYTLMNKNRMWFVFKEDLDRRKEEKDN